MKYMHVPLNLFICLLEIVFVFLCVDVCVSLCVCVWGGGGGGGGGSDLLAQKNVAQKNDFMR